MNTKTKSAFPEYDAIPMVDDCGHRLTRREALLGELGRTQRTLETCEDEHEAIAIIERCNRLELAIEVEAIIQSARVRNAADEQQRNKRRQELLGWLSSEEAQLVGAVDPQGRERLEGRIASLRQKLDELESAAA